MTQRFLSGSLVWILPLAILSLLASGLLISRTSRAEEKAGCPNAAAGEKPEDCPWADWGRELLRAAEKGEPVGPKLRELAPGIVSQIESDAKRTPWKNLWGRSINYDELAKGTIIHPALVGAMSEIYGTKVEDRLVHAGLEHTYGYLFSVLKTPFGYKRARWVQGVIEEGLGIQKGLLGPKPAEGTLLSNATYFFGRIAFRGEKKELRTLGQGKPGISKVIRNFDFSSLPVTRLEETIRKSEAGKTRIVVLRTDLVPFRTVPVGQNNSFLLIYSVKDSLDGSRLITAFPVEKSFVERVSDPQNLGDEKPIVTRYNGHVDGITGQTHSGTRILQSRGEK